MSTQVKLHSSIFHPTLRKIQENNVEIRAHNLMYPVFIIEDDNTEQPIASMPGVSRYGVLTLKKALEPLIQRGLKSILLFGVPENIPKDSTGTGADSPINPVVRALPLLRSWFPDLLIACDVCLCPYTDHGHCGVFRSGSSVFDNAKSIQRIAEIALTYAKAGAHIVAPSDMMDNRISAIKQALTAAGLEGSVNILSYSVKFASNFYGPFRDAAQSKPAFGDRKCYQLPPGSVGLASRAAARDVSEGADMLMVKPALAYLDVLRKTKDEHPNLPMFAYQVSGEYSMLLSSSNGNTDQLKPVLQEVMLAYRRAGADVVISYFAPLLLEWMQHDSQRSKL